MESRPAGRRAKLVESRPGREARQQSWPEPANREPGQPGAWWNGLIRLQDKAKRLSPLTSPSGARPSAGVGGQALPAHPGRVAQ